MLYTLTSIYTNKFTSVSSSLILRTPLDKKTATYNTLLTMLLKTASNKFPRISQLNQRLEDSGGMLFYADVLKKGTQHLIQFYTEVLPEYFTSSIEFLSDIILDPYLKNGSFDETIFSHRKEELLKIIHSRKDDKKNYAKSRCLAEIFPTAPFGIYADGYEDILLNITPQSLYSYYKTLLLTPFDFFTVGNIEEKKADTAIKKYFNDFTRTSFTPVPKYDFPAPSQQKTISEKDNITQSILCLSYRTNGNFIPLLIGNEILGGSGNSILFNDIRENFGLCYSISSSVYRFSHILLIQAGINISDLSKIIEMINISIEKLRSGKFDAPLLDSAKKSLIYQYTVLSDRKNSIIDNTLLHLMTQDKRTLDNIISEIKAAKKNDIITAFSDITPDITFLLEAE